MRARIRNMGSIGDTISAGVETLSNDVQSAGNWIGQEFNSLSAQGYAYSGQNNPLNANGGDNPAAYGTAMSTQTGQALNSIASIPGNIVNAVGSLFGNVLMVAGVGLIIYGVLEDGK
jgi:hypothetical protein